MARFRYIGKIPPNEATWRKWKAVFASQGQGPTDFDVSDDLVAMYETPVGRAMFERLDEPAPVVEPVKAEAKKKWRR